MNLNQEKIKNLSIVEIKALKDHSTSMIASSLIKKDKSEANRYAMLGVLLENELTKRLNDLTTISHE